MNIDVQHIAIDRKERVETGPVQFNDDWPGVFIRGDSALWFAAVLKVSCKQFSAANCGLKMHDMERLTRILESCDVRSH